MNPKVEIFSQGEEVVTGQVADTNAAWLSSHLVTMGFHVSRHTAVGDNLNDLVSLLQEISTRADCCICTGGLGPTTDDLTREAVATAFNAPLSFDNHALETISRFFQSRDMTMPDVNRQQAFFPQGSERIDNDWGTAPGFSFKYQQCLFFFVAGVPFEMRHLFDEKIKPSLEQIFSLHPQQLVTLKTFGIGESDLQVCLNTMDLPEDIKISFKAGMDENQIKLVFPNDYPSAYKTALVQQIANKIGDAVFAIDGLKHKAGGLVDVVSELLDTTAQTVALIETVSHGLLAAKCLGNTWLLESSCNLNLESLAQKWHTEINSDLLAMAEVLAKKLLQQSKADLALVQLYNGDQNTFKDKESQISLYNLLLTPQGVYHQTHTLSGVTERKQNKAAMLGLDLLRRYLQQKTL